MFLFYPIFSTALEAGAVPIWPKKYNFRGVWSIPYWQSIREPIEVHTDLTDEAHPRQSVYYFTSLYQQVDSGEFHYEVQESPEGQFCLIQDGAQQPDKLVEFLPNLAEYTEIDPTVINGRQVRTFQKHPFTERPEFYYNFYIDIHTGDPVRFFQFGRSIMNSHPTTYILDFEDYGATADASKFVPNPSCFMPGSFTNDTTHGPTRSVFDFPRTASKMTSEERKMLHTRQTDLGAHPRSFYGEANNEYCQTVDHIDLGVELPEEFTWKHRGILGMPRDQAACGSCWAQAAGKTISSQIALHYNRYIEASVQQIVDCTWKKFTENNNMACSGGNPYLAFQRLDDMKLNITSEDDYPYLGISGKCAVSDDKYSASVTKGYGRVVGCKQFLTKSASYEDTKQLIKAALYKYGPLVVLIKSTQKFGMLGKEVFDDPQCMPTPESDKNHAVTLSGWTKDAWEIQNSWSTDWGDEGYGYISYNHDCGLSDEPIIPLLQFDD